MRKKVSFILFIICALCLYPAISIAKDVTLTWDPVSGTNVAGYRLYARAELEKYDDSDPEPECQPNSTRCTVTGLNDSTSYYFVVRAYDDQGNESGDSNEVYLAATTGDTSDGTPNDPPNRNLGDGTGDEADAGGCFINTLIGD